MASIFDRLRAAVSAKAPTAGSLEKSLAEAVAAREQAEATLERLLQRRRELLTGDDNARAQHRLAIRDAEDDLEDARAYVAEIGRRHSEAQAAEVEAKRLQAYRDADMQAAAAAKALQDRYPKLAAELASLLRQCAEADIAVSAANAFLPAGAPPLCGPESRVRDLPAVPREALEPTEETVWVYSLDQTLVPEAKFKDIEEHRAPEGLVHSLSSSSGAPRRVEKRRMIRTGYREGQPFMAGARLVDVRLPGLCAGDPDVWDASTGRPDEILARLQQLAAAKPMVRLPGEVRTTFSFARPAEIASSTVSWPDNDRPPKRAA